MKLKNPFGGLNAPAHRDRIGAYPKDVDLPTLSERRYLWTARAMAVALTVSLLANTALGFGIAALLPLVRVMPVLIGFHEPSNQVVTLEPLDLEARGLDYMTEFLIRQYVTVRNSVVNDEQEMTRRWGVENSTMRLMSTDDAYNQFAQETKIAYDRLVQEKFTRSVEILSVSKIAENYWQAEFQTRDHSLLAGLSADQDPTGLWVASMRIEFHPQRISFDNRLVNPLGFTVTAYSVTAKKGP